MIGVKNLGNPYRRQPYPDHNNWPSNNAYGMYDNDRGYPYDNDNYSRRRDAGARYTRLEDYGPEPFVVNIENVTRRNDAFRTALWTGAHLQLTLMSIDVGEDIGLEVHPHLDQFIRIEEGQGLVQMGKSRDFLDYRRRVHADYAFIIPAGMWHNLTNTGDRPIKLYSIYAPPEHPRGTVHETRAIAQASETNMY